MKELNIAAHRAPVSVWDRPGWDGTRQTPIARWLLGAGGTALAFEGFRRRGISGSFFAALGGSVAWWALTGEGDLSDARRWMNELWEWAPWHHEDIVHDASADSFPASDPPAFTSAVGTGIRRRPH
jgi:uncharacterized membrane protein